MSDFLLDSLHRTGHLSADVRRQIIDEIKRLRADAARWRYVRDNMTYVHETQHFTQYRFRPTVFSPGETVTDAVDRLIKEQGS